MFNLSPPRGKRGGERCLARGVPPWTVVLREVLHVTEREARAESARRTCMFPHRLQPVVVGRRSVPPTWWRRCMRGRQQEYRGVSDHAKCPLGLPSLRPRTWSLTPRLKGVGGGVRAISPPQLLREFRPAHGPYIRAAISRAFRRDSPPDCTRVLTTTWARRSESDPLAARKVIHLGPDGGLLEALGLGSAGRVSDRPPRDDDLAAQPYGAGINEAPR